MVAILATGGAVHEWAAGRNAAVRASTAETLERWVAGGLAHGTAPDGTRLFDPAEVINAFKWAGLNGEDGFWREHWIATGRRMTTEFADADRPGGGFRVRLVRTFDVSGLGPGADLLLRAPLPLDGPDHRVVDISVDTEGDLAGRIEAVDGRLTARLRLDGRQVVRLGATTTLVHNQAGLAASGLTAEEAELYLRPAEGFIRVGPRVSELAERWAAGWTGWDAVMAFWRRLNTDFCLGVMRYDVFAAAAALDWVLDAGWFDCVLGSALLVSLCRARGMPARLVAGGFLYPLNPSNHTWAEIWRSEGGWTPVDLAGWDLSAGDSDEAWSDHFVGAIDRRMVAERPPRRFLGPMTLRLPPAWRILQTARDEGLELRYIDALTGRALYMDALSVEPIA